MDTRQMISRIYDGKEIEPEEGQQMVDHMTALSEEGKAAINDAYGAKTDQKIASWIDDLLEAQIVEGRRTVGNSLYTGLLLGIGLGRELTEGAQIIGRNLEDMFGGGKDEQGS